MPETLVLRLNNTPIKQHSWIVVDAAGTRIGEVEHGTLAEVKRHAEQRNLTVLLPANECLVTHSDLPLTNRQKLAQALPFAFEDQVIGDSAKTHFAAGERDESGLFSVVAIERTVLDRHLEELTEYQLEATKVFAEDSMLPSTPDGCSVLLEAREGLIRTSNGDVVAMDIGSIASALHLADLHRTRVAPEHSGDDETGDADEPPMPITVYIDDVSGSDGELAINQINDLFPHTEFRRLPHGALSKLAVESLNSEHPNFLQGDYAPSTSYEKIFEPWRYAAVAAGLFVATIIGYKAVEFSTMKSRLEQANASMLQLAKQTFPSQERIPDPVALFKSRAKVSASGGETGSVFLDYMDTVATATSTTNGLDVRRLNYRTGNLDLELLAPNVQALDGFTSTITSTEGWSANLTSTKSTGETVQGRVTIERGAP